MGIMNILLGLGIGALIGLILAPLVLWIISKLRETKARNKIKEMLEAGKIMMPIDEKDYDTTMWKDHIPKNAKEVLNNLDTTIFKRNDTNNMEVKNEIENKS